MKIDIVRLKENKLESFQESLLSSDLDLETNDIKYKGKINISTQVKKEMQVLYTDTHVSATILFRCSRCLKECNEPIERDFDIKYPLDKSEKFIDVTRDIREEIILGYPAKFLCKTGCLGLCPKCGLDLNEGECDCQIKT